MEVADINASCKSTIFKSVLSDLMYSFRVTVKKLTGAKADIKLGKIRVTPIKSDGAIVIGRIKNLVGGKLACAFDLPMVNFLNTDSEYAYEDFTVTEMFAIDFFDSFSSMSKNGVLQLNTTTVESSKSEWENSIYYIKFDTKLFTKGGKVIPSSFIIAVDEITSMYFKD